MDTQLNGSVGKWAWLGAVWQGEPSADPEDAIARSDRGETRPLSDLLQAIYRQDAVPYVLPAAPSSVPPVVDATARAQGRIDHARAQGVAVPRSQADGLFFDVGTPVEEGAWSMERRAFNALPLGSDELPRLRNAIVGEQRETITIRAWDVRMSKTSGRLGDPADRDRAAVPTRRAFQSWCQRAGIGAVPEHWPLDIRASTVNALATRYAQIRPHLSASDPDPTVVFRVQRARQRLFACVTESYTPFDGDRIVEALDRALPSGSRVSVTYDPDAARGKVEVVTLQEERPVVGEPFRTSFTVGWDDTGSGSIWGDGGLFSARCLNLTRIYTSAGSFRIRHVGSVARLASRFRAEFDRVAKIVHGFAVAYGHAASEELTDRERREGRDLLEGVYRSLLQRELVTVRGRREDAVRVLAEHALTDENQAGLTRAGVANGITRYAHRTNTDPWLRDDLERAAGRILASRVPVRLDYVEAE